MLIRLELFATVSAVSKTGGIIVNYKTLDAAVGAMDVDAVIAEIAAYSVVADKAAYAIVYNRCFICR